METLMINPKMKHSHGQIYARPHNLQTLNQENLYDDIVSKLLLLYPQPTQGKPITLSGKY